jgi:hypothetical protein
MNLKKIYIVLFLILIVTTALLMTAVVSLVDQKGEHRETIARLSRKTATLEEKVALYEKEKEKFEFYRFKQNVFNLKYPDYSKIARIVFNESKKYGFDPYLIMAVIQVESDFDQYAVSPIGAYGLMQVNYSVWKDPLAIDFNRIYEKEYNIVLGLKILKHYYEESAGNIFMALYRYNNGYKYRNEEYNTKIISTKFYSHKKEGDQPKNKDKERSI